MPQRDPDYYAILNLPRESSDQEIHEQYRRLVMVFHPDRNSGDKWSERQLKLYNEAYGVLSDPTRKAAYDRTHAQRCTDGLDFEANFDAPEDKSAETAQQSWSFDAAPRADRPSDANQGAAATGAPSGSLFDDVHVARATPPHHAVGPQRREWHPWRYFAGFATALVLVAVVKIIDDADTGVVPPSATASASRLSSGPKSSRRADPPASVVQALKSASQAAQITQADVHQADTQRHDQAAALRERLAPYWNRYKKDRAEAEADGDRGEQALQSMEGKVGAASTDVRQLKETALRADLSSLDDLSSALQDQFDDLTYTSEDENVNTVLSQINQELTSLERADSSLRQEMANDER